MSLNQADINANDFQWNDDHDTNIYQTRAVEVVTWNRVRKWGMLEEIKTWNFACLKIQHSNLMSGVKNQADVFQAFAHELKYWTNLNIDLMTMADKMFTPAGLVELRSDIQYVYSHHFVGPLGTSVKILMETC